MLLWVLVACLGKALLSPAVSFLSSHVSCSGVAQSRWRVGFNLRLQFCHLNGVNTSSRRIQEGEFSGREQGDAMISQDPGSLAHSLAKGAAAGRAAHPRAPLLVLVCLLPFGRVAAGAMSPVRPGLTTGAPRQPPASRLGTPHSLHSCGYVNRLLDLVGWAP